MKNLELGAPHTVDLLKCVICYLDFDLKPMINLSSLEWFPERLLGEADASNTHKPKSSKGTTIPIY